MRRRRRCGMCSRSGFPSSGRVTPVRVGETSPLKQIELDMRAGEPKLGTIARARDVGVHAGAHKHVWSECVDCGRRRWVVLKRGSPASIRCQPCAARLGAKTVVRPSGPDHPGWRGGRHVMTLGYVRVAPPKEHPLAAMADKGGRVYEHRWVMACSLGRLLSRDEEVHHINGDKQDNRLENLKLTSKREHIAEHHREVTRLRARVRELEGEVQRLRDGAA